MFLGTITAGEWHKIELRLKLNDLGASNGEFLFFLNDELKVQMTGMSNMIPDNSYHITHARFTVFNNWPGAVNVGSGLYSYVNDTNHTFWEAF